MTTLISILMGTMLSASIPQSPAQSAAATAAQMQEQQEQYAMQCYLMYLASRTGIHIPPVLRK